MDLLKAWSAAARDAIDGRFILEADRPVLLDKKHGARVTGPRFSWKDLIGGPDFGDGKDSRLHLSLIPEPFIGDPGTASVVVLLLNPGLEPIDYYAQQADESFRQALLNNLKGAWNPDYPFLYLDPKFAWTGGFQWWNRKLGSVIARLAKDRGLSFAKARQLLAQQLATIELLPYHSEVSGFPDAFRKSLRSVDLARHYAKGELLNRARAGKCKIIVTRQVDSWAIKAGTGVLLYPKTHARSAGLSMESDGGRAIKEAVDSAVPRP